MGERDVRFPGLVALVRASEWMAVVRVEWRLLRGGQVVKHTQCALAGAIAGGERIVDKCDRLFDRCFQRMSVRNGGCDRRAQRAAGAVTFAADTPLVKPVLAGLGEQQIGNLVTAEMTALEQHRAFAAGKQ